MKREGRKNWSESNAVWKDGSLKLMSISKPIKPSKIFTRKAHDIDKQEIDFQRQYEKKETCMVIISHTIVDPLAMVVEPLYTLIADVAMA